MLDGGRMGMIRMKLLEDPNTNDVVFVVVNNPDVAVIGRCCCRLCCC